MKVGDLVRVHKQPSNFIHFVKDKVGIVTEINDYIDIRCLNLDGNIASCGSIPEDCLIIETRPEWIEAKLKHEEIMAKYEREVLANTIAYDNLINGLSKQFKIKRDTIIKIHAALRNYY